MPGSFKGTFYPLRYAKKVTPVIIAGLYPEADETAAEAAENATLELIKNEYGDGYDYVRQDEINHRITQHLSRILSS